MYNVLEKLRHDATLSAREKTLQEHGLVSLLGELHDRLDTAVLAAYGWSDLAPALVGQPGGTLPLADKAPAQAEAEQELLTRLVALNAERAAEEARGTVRWLRPEFQAPDAAPATQGEIAVAADTPAAPAAKGKRAWPNALPAQVEALRTHLATAGHPQAVTHIASQLQRAN